MTELENELLEALERTLPLITAAAKKEAREHALWKNRADIVEISSTHRDIYAVVTAAIKKAKHARGNGDA